MYSPSVIFYSEIFAAFFAAVFALYWAMAALRPPLRERVRVALLLVASFYFYASWNRFLAVLVFATTAVDYFVALADEVADPQPPASPSAP